MDGEFASTVMSGLQKKGADVNFVNKLCAAANSESSGKMKLATRLLANRKTERRLHAYFSRSLPKVSSIKLPLLVNKKKKLVRQVSCRAPDASSHTIL